MRRRAFIAGLASAAVLPVISPLVARAQRGDRVRRIGVLILDSPEGIAPRMPAFLGALEETGYSLGRNVAIEYRSAEHRYERFPTLAAELVRRQVDVIFAIAGPSSVVAAKEATTSIPIVFAIGEDPVKIGLVASFARPGGNITGITFMSEEIAPRRLQLLHELVPVSSRIGVLFNPSDTSLQAVITDAAAAASAMGLKIESLPAANDHEIDAAFASLMDKQIDAILVYPSLFFFERREQIVTLAARHAVPAIYFDRPFAQAGGLMSYGTDFSDMYRQVGLYIGRIFNGEQVADLPVVRLTKFDFVINRRAARQLGIEVPPVLLAKASEVIE